MKRVLGKNIAIKIDGKLYAGTTDVKWSNTPQVETSLIKEDDGEENDEVVGFERKISISGIVGVTDAGEVDTHTDAAGIEAAMEAGEAIPFVYGTGVVGEPERKGNLKLMSYNEDSASSGYATWSTEAKVMKTGYSLGVTV